MKTRQPTPAEIKVADRYRTAIREGRSQINGMLAGLNLLSQAEQFRRIQVDAGALLPAFSPPFVTPGDRDAPQAILDSWNKLEAGLSGLEIKQFAAQIVTKPDGQTDLNIIAPPPVIESEIEGLGGWFVVALVVAGVAYVTHCITDADKTRTEAKKLAYQYSDRLAAIDQKMAKAPESVRAAYAGLKKSTNYKKEESLLDRIVGGAKGIGVGAGAAVAIGLLLYGFSRRSR